MSNADRCVCCGEIVPEGTQVCPKCNVFQEPPAKFVCGQLVKIELKDRGIVYYNYVTDSYYNKNIRVHMYRLAEMMAMPVYREDWLEAVSADEVQVIKASGKLSPRSGGGWKYPIEEVTV